jgi:cobalamin biosynthesis protein CobD/CbiB
MHEPEQTMLSKSLSPVKWRRAFAEAIKPRMRRRTNCRLVTTVAIGAIATVLVVIVVLC